MDKKFNKTWNFLLLATAILFSIIGIAMIVFDHLYLKGFQGIVTAVIFIYARSFINKKEIAKQS